VSLDIEHPQNGRKSRSKVDLYEDKQVDKLSGDAGEKLALRADLLQLDLETLTGLLEHHREQSIGKEGKQTFFFDNEIRPILAENSIEIIDTIRTSQVVVFRGATTEFFVNISDYRNRDGVLLYRPNKAPLFWTFKNEQRYCKETKGLVKQYFVCSRDQQKRSEYLH